MYVCLGSGGRLSDAGGQMEFSCVSQGTIPRAMLDSSDGESLSYLLANVTCFLSFPWQCSSLTRARRSLFGSERVLAKENARMG